MWFRRRRGYYIKACKMISGMRQVSFATAMRSNKYQGRLTQTLLQKSQIKIVIVTTGLFHSFKRMLIWEDHWQVQWFLGNHCKFQWFWSNHCKFSMVFEETITIECFLAVWPLPPMVFQWFLILLPSLSMVFDGSGPLVKQCDGFDGLLWSIRGHQPVCYHLNMLNFSPSILAKLVLCVSQGQLKI